MNELGLVEQTSARIEPAPIADPQKPEAPEIIMSNR